MMIPVGQVLLPALFLVALLALDISLLRRPQRVTLIASTAIIAVAAIKLFIWATPTWLHFAAWAAALFRH